MRILLNPFVGLLLVCKSSYTRDISKFSMNNKIIHLCSFLICAINLQFKGQRKDVGPYEQELRCASSWTKKVWFDL